jgi:hypothetical protein
MRIQRNSCEFGIFFGFTPNCADLRLFIPNNLIIIPDSHKFEFIEFASRFVLLIKLLGINIRNSNVQVRYDPDSVRKNSLFLMYIREDDNSECQKSFYTIEQEKSFRLKQYQPSQYTDDCLLQEYINERV